MSWSPDCVWTTAELLHLHKLQLCPSGQIKAAKNVSIFVYFTQDWRQDTLNMSVHTLRWTSGLELLRVFLVDVTLDRPPCGAPWTELQNNMKGRLVNQDQEAKLCFVQLQPVMEEL